MSIYGSRQKSSSRKKVSLDANQGAAIDANKSNLGSIKDLASSASSADTDTLMSQIEKVFPGFSNFSGKAGQVISDYLSGNFGQQNEDKMADRAAARGISTGTAGSQFSGFRELRNYGTSLMEMQQKGIQMYQQQTQLAKSLVNPMSVTSMFTTPDKRYAASLSESDRDAEMMSHNNALAAGTDPSAIAAQDDARMRQVAGLQTRNAVAMSNNAAYAGGSRMPYQMRTGSLWDYRNRSRAAVGGRSI